MILSAEFEIGDQVLGIRQIVADPSDQRCIDYTYERMTKMLIEAAIPKEVVP